MTEHTEAQNGDTEPPPGFWETDEPEQEEICGHNFTTGGHDPYGTSCDLPPRHEGKHRGHDPFGGDGHVEWLGGGSCAGDPLPYREVEWSQS